MTQRAECVVIGGGLAGGMAALRLARAGRSVLLIEKQAEAHHKVCGEFLSPEAVAYLRDAGLGSTLRSANAIRRLRLSVGGRSVATELPFTALSLSRFAVDELLLERASGAGCTLLRGVAVEGLDETDGSWKIALNDGRLLGADHVFLATGKHDLRSHARPRGVQSDLVGFKLHLRLLPQQARELQGWMDLFLFRGGYGGLSLVENGTGNLCLVVRKSRLRALGAWENLWTQLLRENRSLRDRMEGAEPLWDRPLAISSIPYGYLAESAGGMWLLGDQAAVIPSFTGDGMSIALHSGALAVERFLAGDTADVYLGLLREQLGRGMQLGTTLSRAMVTGPGRAMAPYLMGMLPQSMRWIAAWTRIPAPALRVRLAEIG